MSALDDLPPPSASGSALDALPPPQAAPVDINNQRLDQIMYEAGKSFLGTAAHGIGTVGDVFRNDVRVFKGQPTVDYGSPESYAAKLSAPFAVAPTKQELQEPAVIAPAISKAYDRVAGTGPAAQTIKENAPAALEAASTIAGIGEGAGALTDFATRAPVVPEAQAIVERQAAAQPTNMGAAAAAPRVSAASPELQQAVVKAANKTGGAVNTDVLTRHLEADSLPVPVKLTEGQATQDPVLISQEQNMRGEQPVLAKHFEAQNKALNSNVQEIRDRIGPDVFTTNPVEHGDTLIEAYKAKDAAAQADIASKYQALKDANGGDFPVDGVSFVQNADAALRANMKRQFLPSPIQNILDEYRGGQTPMTLENFENLRTTLAAESRKAARAGDGNAQAAISLVRNELENLPMSGETADVKALADQARSAAKARFDALRADPAYNAAVNDTVSPDRFVSRFLINGPRDDVAVMRANLADNPVATQTMGVATLDHLRASAGLDSDFTGNFSQARYNKAMTALDPKLTSLVDPQTADQLQTLGSVARYTQAQPRGAFVSNSGTTPALLARFGSNAIEDLANAAVPGARLGTVGRSMLERGSAGRSAQAAIAPGAGLDRLNAAAPTPYEQMIAAARAAAGRQKSAEAAAAFMRGVKPHPHATTEKQPS